MGHVRSKMVQQSHPGLPIIPVFTSVNLPPLLPRRRKYFYCKQSTLLGCTPVSLFFLSKSSGFSRVKHFSSIRSRDKQNHDVSSSEGTGNASILRLMMYIFAQI